MRFLLAALTLLLQATPNEDAVCLKEMLDLSASGPQEKMRERLQDLARGLKDPDLRTKATGAIDDLIAASVLHRKVTDLAKEVTELGGLVKVEGGGPAWLRAAAGDDAMRVFDRLVTLGMNDKTNPHFKDYKLNTRVNDAWLEKLAGLPDLRSLDIANMDVRGPGLSAVGTLRTLESLNLTLTPVTDEPLGALAGLTGLKILGLASTKSTGTGMERLQTLRKLENLNFHSCPVTDAGLQGIGKMSSLLRLEIVHTQFSDAGTPALSGLVNLERLQLGSRKATGAGLAFLRDLPKLRELDVHDGMLSAEGFRNVGAVKTLRVLRAYGGTGGDEGLRALAELSELETLILEGVGISDAGLETLAKLPRLRKLTLHEPKVSEAAAGKLRAALPSLEIVR